jgi:hypothetical protein
VFFFEIGDKSTLIIKKEECRHGWESGLDLCDMPYDDSGLNLSKSLKSYKFWILDISSSVAMLTSNVRVTGQRCSKALSGHLKQSKLG